MDPTFVIVVIFSWVLSVGISWGIGREKGMEGLGLLLGVSFSWVGVAIIALIDRGVYCPECGNKLNGRPNMCFQCKTRFKWSESGQCEYFPPE